MPYQCDEQHHSRFLNQAVPHVLVPLISFPVACQLLIAIRARVAVSLPLLALLCLPKAQPLRNARFDPSSCHCVTKSAPYLHLASELHYCTSCYSPVDGSGALPISTIITPY